jgi:hypothetical protein
MGKLQDAGRTNVKREVVSASANLEVISQESFVRRLEGMSSACHNCHKERTLPHRNNKPGRKGKAGRRKQLAKSNTTIVIHLKDTLRFAGKHRQSSLDGDSDVSARSTDEDQYTSSGSSSGQKAVYRPTAASKSLSLDYQVSSIYGDVASIPEFVPQYRGHHFHQVWPQPLYHHVSLASSTTFPRSAVTHKTPNHSSLSTAQKAKEKSRKNLTALISVIEKAHMKESKDIEPNLSRNSTDAKLRSVLNNVSLSSQNDSEMKLKNMAGCENVELICNDLSKGADKLVESTDDSDSSEKASVQSSSDTISDDAVDRPALREASGHEFLPKDLEQLVEFTMGSPLIRYDCQPSQCPECVAVNYSQQHFHFEGCSLYTAPKTSHFHSTRRPPHFHIQQQQHTVSNCSGQRQKVAASPRTSTSSDSDALSDVEGSSTASSSSSSLSSSSSSLTDKTPASAHAGKRTATKVTPVTKTSSRHPRPGPSTSRTHWSHEPRDKQPVKRATASWKSARQLWDIDVSQAHRQARAHSCGMADSVYMDLTGLDVSISVMYHTELPVSTPTWPYPVHALYQAVYSPNISAPPPRFNHPFRFNNQTVYPHNIDLIPFYERKKYELSAPPNRPWITTGTPDKEVPAAVFTVMCYNVLCDKLCTKAMYAYCPTWALSWNYRKKGIMNDILRGNADIITLQVCAGCELD